MKKYTKILLLLLILAGIWFAFVSFRERSDDKPSPSPEVSTELKTTLTVGEKSFDILPFIGKSALEATKANAKVEERGTDVNAFVTSINGVIADSKKNEFWELVINGASAQVGAGSYIIQNGDSILWKLSNY